MYVDMLDNEDLVALRQVFDKTCIELGLGTNSDDNGRREQLAKAILSLAQARERDPIAIEQTVVRMMHGEI